MPYSLRLQIVNAGGFAGIEAQRLEMNLRHADEVGAGTDLVGVAKIHFEPLCLYPGKTASVDDLKA